MNIIIATIKSWNIKNAEQFKNEHQGQYNVTIITDKDQLNIESVKRFNPDYIFFPHWSYIVPEEIYNKYECVVFHMTDLPFGRGGSPLQNLIVRGIYDTRISAIRVSKGIDTGDVYLKEPFSIKEGNADEILKSISDTIFNKMIPEILTGKYNPKPQEGETVVFKRRTPSQSELLPTLSMEQYYDYIRMLDGEGYPSAFINYGNKKFTFTNVSKTLDGLKADVEIHENKRPVVLVVAAHPDDEILGVGATISKMVKNGYYAYALIMAEGQTSRWSNRADADKTVLKNLHSNTLKAADCIGYKKVIFADFPDNQMDSIDLLDITKFIEKYVDELKPEIVFTHHEGDLNIDHQLTARATLTATRPIGDYSVKKVYEFETVSSTEWNFGNKEEGFYPNYFVDINDTFNNKIKAMKCYTSELRDFPHPRSLQMLEAEAARWGAYVGLDKAEAFELVREVCFA